MHHLSILEQDCKLQTYIMHRFFMSLPDRLAFFVRADRLKKLAQAFESALSGAACGYRESDSPVMMQPTATTETYTTMPLAAATSQAFLDNLIRKIEILSTQVNYLRVSCLRTLA